MRSAQCHAHVMFTKAFENETVGACWVENVVAAVSCHMLMLVICCRVNLIVSVVAMQACLQLCIKGAADQLPDAVEFLKDDCKRLRAGFQCSLLLLPILSHDDAVPSAPGGNVILW